MSTTETPSRWRTLAATDPEINDAIRNEQPRQSTGRWLIASENFASQAVLQAAGSVMTNKYAEGYPGKRYYGGCEFVDVGENLARDRAQHRFSAEHANVPPHSGAPAHRAAALRVAGQHGGVPVAAQAGRHGAGARSGPRRPPDSRHEAEHLGDP